MNTNEKSRNVVITGGTRGIGFCMVKEFLDRGCNVTFSGTREETLRDALTKLDGYRGNVHAVLCDVKVPGQIVSLWDQASTRWGAIDIWINNAGINQPYAPVWEVPSERILEIAHTNIAGMICGSQVAMKGMIKQSSGAVYNMEGWGANGRHMNNLNVYGTSKRALRYFTEGLAEEAKEHGIIVGALSPGMMVTDFIIEPLRNNAKRLENMRRVINLVADKPENVAVFLVEKMLSNRKTGVRFEFFTTGRFIGRMFSLLFSKRDLLANFGL
jgi:NAD(P)-dependent dehydrogenase (short-subunit alcohol dehydrogenase family)